MENLDLGDDDFDPSNEVNSSDDESSDGDEET